MPDGDPPRQFYARRVNDRLVSELLGVCKGVVADGVVTADEAIALRTWLESHPETKAGFPGRELVERLDHIFADGVIEEAERLELEAMLADLTGEPLDQTGDLNRSTRLPLDDPEPPIRFANREFVFTGHFARRRKDCADRVRDRYGVVANDVRRTTHYLVVGAIASEAWVQGAWGTKILRAVDFRSAGQDLAIVSEAHWLIALESGA